MGLRVHEQRLEEGAPGALQIQIHGEVSETIHRVPRSMRARELLGHSLRRAVRRSARTGRSPLEGFLSRPARGLSAGGVPDDLIVSTWKRSPRSSTSTASPASPGMSRGSGSLGSFRPRLEDEEDHPDGNGAHRSLDTGLPECLDLPGFERLGFERCWTCGAPGRGHRCRSRCLAKYRGSFGKGGRETGRRVSRGGHRQERRATRAIEGNPADLRVRLVTQLAESTPHVGARLPPAVPRRTHLRSSTPLQTTDLGSTDG